MNMTNTFDPEMIVVGGGVGALGELLLTPAREMVRKLAIPPGRDSVRIAGARLGNRAGLVGGALTAWQWLGETGRGRSGAERRGLAGSAGRPCSTSVPPPSATSRTSPCGC